jgi:hypothetical protein
MLSIASTATQKLIGVLAAPNGVPASLEALTSLQSVNLPPITAQQIVGQNVAADIAEQSLGSKYPLIYAYCGKVVNGLQEKFRTFSGEARMLVEARVSQDRLDNLESTLHTYADAIASVLDGNRGDWGDGFFYAGGYEVQFNKVKHGGLNFLQIAEISFAL